MRVHRRRGRDSRGLTGNGRDMLPDPCGGRQVLQEDTLAGGSGAWLPGRLGAHLLARVPVQWGRVSQGREVGGVPGGRQREASGEGSVAPWRGGLAATNLQRPSRARPCRVGPPQGKSAAVDSRVAGTPSWPSAPAQDPTANSVPLATVSFGFQHHPHSLRLWKPSQQVGPAGCPRPQHWHLTLQTGPLPHPAPSLGLRMRSPVPAPWVAWGRHLGHRPLKCPASAWAADPPRHFLGGGGVTSAAPTSVSSCRPAPGGFASSAGRVGETPRTWACS